MYERKTEWDEDKMHSKVCGRTKKVEKVRDQRRVRGGFVRGKSGWGMKRRGRGPYKNLNGLDI